MQVGEERRRGEEDMNFFYMEGKNKHERMKKVNKRQKTNLILRGGDCLIDNT